MKLFPREHIIGIFRGFSEGGLEFHADLVLPYRPDLQILPMHGQFVLVALESDDEAVLGRITAISAQGRLSSGAGEEYSLRAIRDDRPVPEDLREQYLKYEVDIRVLGVLRTVDGEIVYAASHRRLPHVGSKVAFLSPELLREVASATGAGAELGYFALGEFIYAGGDKRLVAEPWMRVLPDAVIPRFQVEQLVSRRTFIFARAGFGKSNLVKLLFTGLYSGTPTVTKRGDRKVPVGTVIFDPDGEYFWPDDKNRPGLADVPELRDQLVVFTNKEAPSDYYGSFVVGGIKLDIRRLRPADVVAIALSPERQDQQNVRKLKSLSDAHWQQLVDEIYAKKNGADPTLVAHLLGLEMPRQEAELYAARSNMTEIVNMLHDPGSQMMDTLLAALRDGKLCVVDVSQMRGTAALVLSGLVLNRIFSHNQLEFTAKEPKTIPTIAVVEEAQSVLGSTGSSGAGPYVSWVKEGRKYDLGTVLITQQPGSIQAEILSQGDNWFIFHLLAGGDLAAAKRANAHFSDDLLSSLLNEPLPGHGVFWSSARRPERSYPIPLRVLLFEALFAVADPDNKRPMEPTYAAGLRKRFAQRLAAVASAAGVETTAEALKEARDATTPGDTGDQAAGEGSFDLLSAIREGAIRAVAGAGTLRARVEAAGMPWKGAIVEIESHLPSDLDDRERIANDLVRPTLDRLFGEGHWKTEQRPSKSRPGANTVWIVKAP